MGFAILAGVLLLLIAGIVIAVRAVAVARREVVDLEEELAEARGLALEPDTGPAPWSSFDLTALGDEVEIIDYPDPYEALKTQRAPASRDPATASNGSGPRSAGALEPIVWRVQSGRPVVILVGGVGFLGGGSSAVSAVARARPETVASGRVSAGARPRARDADTRVVPRASFNARSLRDEIIDVYSRRVNDRDEEPAVHGHFEEPAMEGYLVPDGNGSEVPDGNGSEPTRISWRPPSRSRSR